jgi:hypothetical protein
MPGIPPCPVRRRPAAPRLPGAAVGAMLAWLLLPAADAAPPAGGGETSATRCCTDPAHFRYEPLPADGVVDFEIDSRSPTFEFQSGRSAFRAFELPTAARPYTLEVRSFLEGPADPRRARVFYPVVAILTDDFLVSRATELELLRFDLPVLERTTLPAYRVSVPVDPAATRERYVVVFTPAKLATTRALPPIAGAESAAEAARVAFLGAAPYGKLRITLRPGEIAVSPSPAAEPPAP